MQANEENNAAGRETPEAKETMQEPKKLPGQEEEDEPEGGSVGQIDSEHGAPRDPDPYEEGQTEQPSELEPQGELDERSERDS